MVNDFQALEEKFNQHASKFVYIFAHDTKSDAKKFAKTVNFSNSLLADHDLLKSFKNPDLPAVFVKDRNGWLLYFKEKNWARTFTRLRYPPRICYAHLTKNSFKPRGLIKKF